MELTKKQSESLIKFLEDNKADEHFTESEYSVIDKFIEQNTAKGVVFDLLGEQTDDIKEVYAYMMRNKITRLDTLKKQ